MHFTARFLHSLSLLGLAVAFGAHGADSLAQGTDRGYVFEHVAGSTGGPGHADGKGSTARFSYPVGIGRDLDGSFLVVDTGNKTIRRVLPDGMVSTVFGQVGQSEVVDGPVAVARLYAPRGIALDGAGAIYVNDYSSIRKIAGGVASTIAGTVEQSGFVNGVGAAARFGFIYDIAADVAGNVYVTDFENNAVRRVAPNGTVGTLSPVSIPTGVAVDAAQNVYFAYGYTTIGRISGGSGAVLVGSNGYGSVDGSRSTAQLSGVAGLATDGGGNVYFVETGGTVRKSVPDGTVSTLAGRNGERGAADGRNARFGRPADIAIGADGALYVTDELNHAVRRVSLDGTVTTIAGGNPPEEGDVNGAGSVARFNEIQGIALDALGNIYVADSVNAAIRKISRAGVVTTFYQAQSPALRPQGVAVDAAGYVYATTRENVVLKIAPTGVGGVFAGTIGRSSETGAGTLGWLQGLAMDAAGNVYVADEFGSVVRKIAPTGMVSNFAGQARVFGHVDGTGSSARFYNIGGLVVDAAGNVYVADLAAVRRISPSGVVVTIAGGGASSLGFRDATGSQAKFRELGGITLDLNGNLLVTDWGNAMLRRVTPGGVVTSIAGSAVETGNINGPGEVARFDRPIGVALDAGGNLFVADRGTHTIRTGRLAQIAVAAPARSVELGAPFTASGFNYGGPATMQWQRNGAAIESATGAELALNAVTTSDAGLYRLQVTASGASDVVSKPLILGIKSSSKVAGAGEEVGANIVHPSSRIYDQILLQGASATITADAGEVTRISFVDITGDIVQVEFSGAGTLSLVLPAASAPAPAANYQQPATNYVTGHAGIVIAGANETTHVSVFSVGRITAVNQALFRDDVDYDGMADVAFIAIESANGKFGGVRAANAHFYATMGHTGIFAPEVEFVGPVYVGEVSAFDSATPVMRLGGAAGNVWITGGDLSQENGRAIEVSGIARLEFKPGTDSHGQLLPAKANRARLESQGVDVTAQIVVNP